MGSKQEVGQSQGRRGKAVLRQFAVDRNSPVPLYFQVAQHLEGAIMSGQIPAGTLLANEIRLAEELGVSRPTMRRAMQHLVDQGMVTRRRGVGTRVVQPRVRRQLELTSLYDDLAAAGQEPTTVLLEFDHLPADDGAAEELAVVKGTTICRLQRLRMAEGRPVALMTNLLPEHAAQFLADDLNSFGLYELFRRQGIHLHAAQQTIGARTATTKEARLLEEPKGAALLTMQRHSYDDRGTLVEYASHLYAASRYSFEGSLLAG